jgi:hypothetical protein
LKPKTNSILVIMISPNSLLLCDEVRILVLSVSLCVGTYHDGFLFNSSLHPSQWREMKKEDVELALLKPGFDTRSLTYICCLRKYGEGNTYTKSKSCFQTFKNRMTKRFCWIIRWL